MVYLRVCRYWWEVALSTSSLWTSCSSAQFCHKAAIVPIMKYWLDRSSPTVPLNLQLIFEPNFPPLYANNIFRLLTTEVKRWRSMSIKLDLSLSQEFTALLEERTQDLSQLEELEIHLLPKGVPATISQRILAQIPLLTPLYLGHKWPLQPRSCLPSTTRFGYTRRHHPLYSISVRRMYRAPNSMRFSHQSQAL